MYWIQNHCLCDLSLWQSLCPDACFQNNILFFYFPQSILLWFYSDYHKVDRDIGFVACARVFLHETDDNGRFFVDRQTILRVVEPFIICINFVLFHADFFLSCGLASFRLSFFLFILNFFRCCWVRTTIWISFPFSVNWELAPRFWKDFAHIQSVEVSLPVFKSHPPVIVLVELVAKLGFKPLVIIPSLIFITELSSPLTSSTSPGVSWVDHLEVISCRQISILSIPYAWLYMMPCTSWPSSGVPSSFLREFEYPIKYPC